MARSVSQKTALGAAQVRRRQVAAVCYRVENGAKRVLLITSRDTGRWIVPKGWPIDGLSDAGAALREAWEEAGVKKANIARMPIGSFDYDKRLDDGSAIPVEAEVFAVEVTKLADDFPESDERERRWVSPETAVALVQEDGLKDILRDL